MAGDQQGMSVAAPGRKAPGRSSDGQGTRAGFGAPVLDERGDGAARPWLHGVLCRRRLGQLHHLHLPRPHAHRRH